MDESNIFRVVNSSSCAHADCRQELLRRVSAFSCAFLIEQVQFMQSKRLNELTEGRGKKSTTARPPAPAPKFDCLPQVVKLLLAMSRRLFELDRNDLGSVDAEIGMLCAPLASVFSGDATPAYYRVGVHSTSSTIHLDMYDLLRALIQSVALRKFLPSNAASIDSVDDIIDCRD